MALICYELIQWFEIYIHTMQSNHFTPLYNSFYSKEFDHTKYLLNPIPLLSQIREDWIVIFGTKNHLDSLNASLREGNFNENKIYALQSTIQMHTHQTKHSQCYDNWLALQTNVCAAAIARECATVACVIGPPIHICWLRILCLGVTMPYETCRNVLVKCVNTLERSPLYE